MARRANRPLGLVYSNASILELNGERLTLSQWSRRTGLGHDTILHRLNQGWSIQRALLTPARKYTRRGGGGEGASWAEGASVGKGLEGASPRSRKGLPGEGASVTNAVTNAVTNFVPVTWVACLCEELGPLVPRVLSAADLPLVAEQVIPGFWVEREYRRRGIQDRRRLYLPEPAWGFFDSDAGDGKYVQVGGGTFDEAVLFLKGDG